MQRILLASSLLHRIANLTHRVHLHNVTASIILFDVHKGLHAAREGAHLTREKYANQKQEAVCQVRAIFTSFIEHFPAIARSSSR